MIGIVAGDRDPYMADQPWSIFVEQRQSLPGRDGPGVRIPAATVVAGGSPLNVIFGLGKSREPSRRILRKQRQSQKGENEQAEQFFHLESPMREDINSVSFEAMILQKIEMNSGRATLGDAMSGRARLQPSRER